MKDTENKSKGFLQGALVLGIANLLVKVIGACFKIPLVNILGDDGMGYFNVAYQIYTFMFIVATAGFPTAISKMVAEAKAKDNEKDAKRIFHTAFTFLAIIGFIGTVILFVFDKPLANMMNIPDSALGIKTIAPAVFFVSMACAYRGYFQGRQEMVPTAFSELIEATGKAVIGLVAAGFFINLAVDGSISSAFNAVTKTIQSKHIQTVYASSGAILGVTIGTLCSFLLLTSIYLFTKRKRDRAIDINSTVRPYRTILKELILIAIPITIGASVSSLTTLIDMATISRRLVIRPEAFDRYAFMFSEGTEFFKKAMEEGWQGAELLTQKAASLYGMYSGKALTMFNLPLTLVVALGISVVPAISAALTRKDKVEAARVTESTIRIASLFAAPCTVGMAILSKEVLYILFTSYNAYSVLAILAIAIIPVAIVSVTNAILQAYGRVYYPVITMIIGGLAKVVFNFFFIPYLGIDGAPVGTLLCYLIIAVLNMRGIIKITGIKFNLKEFFIRPILAALIMGAVGFVLTTFLPIESLSVSLGSSIFKLITVAELGVCVVVYGLAIFAVKAVKEEDILNLPKGEKLLETAKKLHLIK